MGCMDSGVGDQFTAATSMSVTNSASPDVAFLAVKELWATALRLPPGAGQPARAGDAPPGRLIRCVGG